MKNGIKQFNPKRIVVTGALGHIGSKIVRDLPESFPGTQIVMIDNLATQRYCSLFNLPKQGKYNFIEADILTINLEKFLMPKDVVIHLAAITDATRSFENQEEIERVNYKATIKLAKACARIGCSLIYPSTTSVYGISKGLVDEDCSRADLKPQSPYAKSKLKSEEYLKKIGKRAKLKFVICRFGTICGTSPGMRFHTAINIFCWQAVMNQPLTVWRTALHQKRPYLTLSDATAALKFIIAKKLYDQKVYNILNENLTVNDIVNKIKQHIPNIKIQLVNSQIMNQLSYEVSSARFQKKGFQCIGSIDSDIANTIELLRHSNNTRPA